MDALAGLNPEQRDAATATEGAVRVAAGPGTGKTRTLVHRFCHLVATLGIAPRNILSVTFTNRAANEMKRRVREALGDMDLGYVCTIHAFCVQLLRDDIHVLSYPKNFVVLDNEDARQILAKIFSDMNLTLRDMTVQRALDEVIEAGKMRADGYIDDIRLLDNERLKARFSAAGDRDEEIFLRYLYEQKKCYGCDFNDLINFAAHILENFEDVRRKWQDRMQYVMVDEFQDVSGKQYKLARILAGGHGNIFIVGDPDQTIYTWRGSHVRMFLDFDKQYPGARTVTLSTNYRSTPEILAAAGALIAKNPTHGPNALVAARGSGPRPLYRHARSEGEEADWIFSEIDKLRGRGTPLGDVAVLYRAHYLSRALEERFVRGGLPYKIYSGVEFYGRREIKDIVCYLRMVAAGDDLAFLRTVNTPPRKLGRKRIEALTAHAGERGATLYEALREKLSAGALRGTGAERYVGAIERTRERLGAMALGDAVQMLLDLSGYEEWLRLRGDQERLDNVAELKRSIAAPGEEAEATLDDFLARAALFANHDREGGDGRVKLMTVHAAKGMEFSHVFVAGLDEGVFPSRRTDLPEEMEEERRLAYVAMTRARDGLYLSDSEGVANDGLFKYPSRFVFDAGRENLDYVVELDAALVERMSRRPGGNAGTGAPPSFRAGDRVVHPVFGTGTVMRADAAEQCYAVKFDALATWRSILFGARLERGEE